MQQSLFNKPIEWADITEEWLLNYLNSNYPDLKFFITDKYFTGEKIIKQGITKRAELELSIIEPSADKHLKGKLVGFRADKLHNGFEGMAEAAANFDEFFESLPRYIRKFEEWRK